jgi:hypothetical protein
MIEAAHDEWDVLAKLLPEGWEQAARDTGAFQRSRYLKTPGELLRLLLFHAVNGSGTRTTTAQARESGIADISAEALLERLRTSGDWLRWIAEKLVDAFRERARPPGSLRPRVLDSTTVQGPASKGTDWRLHYMLDLTTLCCDWHELTDQHGAERIERAPVAPGDVILGDRNFLVTPSARYVVDAGADVLVRMRWCHPALETSEGKRVEALSLVRGLRVDQVGEWFVQLVDRNGGPPIPGRIVALRLSAPAVRRAERRALKKSRPNRPVDPRSIEACKFIMIFTTLKPSQLSAKKVLELYRYRWQVEIAFKRHKQLLKLGALPHKNAQRAQSWILGKLVLALLLETINRNLRSFSPWGYDLEDSSSSSG